MQAKKAETNENKKWKQLKFDYGEQWEKFDRIIFYRCSLWVDEVLSM